MGKVTFVVDFEDGKEPPVHSGMSIFGGSLTDVAWRDALQDDVKLTSESLPSPNQMALLFDANGEGWLIGWRSMWMTMGQRETGEWQWTFQSGDIDDANITHWVEMPEAPEAL